MATVLVGRLRCRARMARRSSSARPVVAGTAAAVASCFALLAATTTTGVGVIAATTEHRRGLVADGRTPPLGHVAARRPGALRTHAEWSAKYY